MKFYIWLFNLLASNKEYFYLSIDRNWSKIGDVITNPYSSNNKRYNIKILAPYFIDGYSPSYIVSFNDTFLEFKKYVNWTITFIIIFIILAILFEI